MTLVIVLWAAALWISGVLSGMPGERTIMSNSVKLSRYCVPRRVFRSFGFKFSFWSQTVMSVNPFLRKYSAALWPSMPYPRIAIFESFL